MIRHIFLFLSKQKGLRKWMETSPLSKKLTSRFIAGETLDDALAVCRQLQRENIWTTLDHLGENVTSLDEAAQSRDAYLAALMRLASLPATAGQCAVREASRSFNPMDTYRSGFCPKGGVDGAQEIRDV